jgi:hypothetical protein
LWSNDLKHHPLIKGNAPMGTPGASPLIDKNLGSIPSKGILFGAFLGELGIISLLFPTRKY